MKILALFAILVVIAMNWFVHRSIAADEVGLYNTIYTFLNSGILAYPAHGYPDSMIVHPPVHYLMIALFIKLGMNTHFAFGTPPILFAIICVIAVVTSPFRTSIKSGILIAIPVTLFLFTIDPIGEFDKWILFLRPEQTLTYAWFAGLIFLESARVEKWNTVKICLGGLLLSYASVLHYFAAPAIIGLVVYLFALNFDLGVRSAIGKSIALIGGASVVLVPYVLFWFLPFNHEIFNFIGNAPVFNGGLFHGLGVHIKNYEYFLNCLKYQPIPVKFINPILLFNLLISLWIWIPLVAYKKTRLFCIACMPMLLFVLIMSRKGGGYFFPEFFLCFAVIFAIIFALFEDKGSSSKKSFIISIILIFLLLYGNPVYMQLDFSPDHQYHEMHLARACSQEIIGNNSLVGGVIDMWYIGGGTYWYGGTWLDVAPDNLQRFSISNLSQYYRSFDYVEMSWFNSDSTYNKDNDTISTRFLATDLQIKGFYLTEYDKYNSFIIFQPNYHLNSSFDPVINGFVLSSNGSLNKFTQNKNGDYILLITVTDANHNQQLKKLRETSTFCDLVLPKNNKIVYQYSNNFPDSQMHLFFILLKKDETEKYVISNQNDTIINLIPGNLTYQNPEILLNKLKHDDKPIQFLNWNYTELQLFDKNRIELIPPQITEVNQNH